MRPEALLRRIRTDRHNVRFSDFIRLARALGFRFHRQEGSHSIYKHPCGAVLILQPWAGEARAYQLKDLLDAVDDFGLRLS